MNNAAVPSRPFKISAQAWEIPFDVLIEATKGDKSEPGKRRAYASSNVDKYEAIRERYKRDEGPFGEMRDV